MKYYSGETVKQIIKDTMEYTMTMSQCVPMGVGHYPSIEIPNDHGRIVDLDKVLDWLINEDGRFSMAMSAKIDNALKNAPILLEASK